MLAFLCLLENVAFSPVLIASDSDVLSVLLAINNCVYVSVTKSTAQHCLGDC